MDDKKDQAMLDEAEVAKHIKNQAALDEAEVAKRIKVGDRINGQVVTEKVWTRDTPGNLTVHVVYNSDTAERVEKLNPQILFTVRDGLVCSGEVYDKKRVETQYIKSAAGWTVQEVHYDLLDVLGLDSRIQTPPPPAKD
ncbi:hypothetical protein IRZ53_00570 [Pseudomonas fulva]|uniref:hypothetical protein n=1 Tax=Pseudomonas fulva TaxID=47880 RepID=UPI0018AAED6E|nr:hypothetical protein [Pseudomonas fulva]MBF8673328.1 hypothetical protein [Pseudomonas fulva]MBF8695281.1 hypothetical protein [Pseudomonas fulva]